MDSLSDENVTELKGLFDKFRLKSKIVSVSERNNSGDNQEKEEDPMETHYEGIFSKFDEMLSKLEIGSTDYLKVLAMKGSLYYEAGKILLNTRTVEKSKEYLQKGLQIIEAHKETPLIAFLHMRILNYLSYVLSILGELENARMLLESANSRNNDNFPVVYTTDELFASKTAKDVEAKLKVDKIIINNMQMLGWVYGKLGMNDHYADMIHQCLQKELDTNEGDPIQWAIRCYRLASLFITQFKWDVASYHLAAAQSLLDPLEMSTRPSSLLFKTQADLARVWVSFVY